MAGQTMLKSHHINLYKTRIKRDREGQNVMRKCPHLQKGITILNLTEPNKVALIFIKRKLMKPK